MSFAVVEQGIEFDLKHNSVPVNVPNDPYAKLMYYLKCLYTVGEEIPSWATEYRSSSLSSQKKNALISLARNNDISNTRRCILVEPDFPALNNSSNAFHEFSALSTIDVAGISRNQIAQLRSIENIGSVDIMFYTRYWRKLYYDEPILAITRSEGVQSFNYGSVDDYRVDNRRRGSCGRCMKLFIFIAVLVLLYLLALAGYSTFFYIMETSFVGNSTKTDDGRPRMFFTTPEITIPSASTKSFSFLNQLYDQMIVSLDSGSNLTITHSDDIVAWLFTNRNWKSNEEQKICRFSIMTVRFGCVVGPCQFSANITAYQNPIDGGICPQFIGICVSLSVYVVFVLILVVKLCCCKRKRGYNNL